jgi:hypothetical protein
VTNESVDLFFDMLIKEDLEKRMIDLMSQNLKPEEIIDILLEEIGGK